MWINILFKWIFISTNTIFDPSKTFWEPNFDIFFLFLFHSSVYLMLDKFPAWLWTSHLNGLIQEAMLHHTTIWRQWLSQLVKVICSASILKTRSLPNPIWLATCRWTSLRRCGWADCVWLLNLSILTSISIMCTWGKTS